MMRQQADVPSGQRDWHAAYERPMGARRPDAPAVLREKALDFASLLIGWDPAVPTGTAREVAAGLLDSGAALTISNNRIFANMFSKEDGVPDGMKVDVEGNVYCTGPGGVWVMDATGKHLGTILTEVAHTTNMAWGGDDWKTLFITEIQCLISA